MTTAELFETVRRVEVRNNRLVNDTMVGAYAIINKVTNALLMP